MGDKILILQEDSSKQEIDEVQVGRQRTRSVSFSLPEDHNEEKEKKIDSRVPALTLQPNGECSVSFEEIMITRKNGTKIIITESRATYIPPEQPASHFRFMKIFAIVGAFMFLPLGIPAIILAFRAHRLYKTAQKEGETPGRSKRAMVLSERLIIVSIVCGLLFWGVVFLVIDNMSSSRKPATMADLDH